MAATLFDAAALTPFFEDANNMGSSNRMCLQLAVEGITVPEDFKEFNNNGMMVIFTNLLKPPKVPATGAAARAAGTLQEIQAYEVSVKSKMWLKGVRLIAQRCWTSSGPGQYVVARDQALPGALERPDGDEEG
jgi:hypothetical protein